MKSQEAFESEEERPRDLQIIREEPGFIPALLTEKMLEEAEKRIPLIKRAKQVALGVTCPDDWYNQQGNPYLSEDGAQKIGGVFGISLGKPKVEQRIDTIDGKQIITWTALIEAKIGSRVEGIEGVASSEDDFFKYRWHDGIKTELPLNERALTSLRKKAVTNAFGRVLKRIIGLGHVTWEDLEPHGITPHNCRGVKYNAGKGAPVAKGPAELTDAHQQLRTMLLEMAGGNSAEASKLLEQYSAFKGRDQKMVPGKQRVDQLSPAAAGMTCQKVKPDYAAWKARQGASGPEAEREPGEDDNDIS